MSAGPYRPDPLHRLSVRRLDLEIRQVCRVDATGRDAGTRAVASEQDQAVAAIYVQSVQGRLPLGRERLDFSDRAAPQDRDSAGVYRSREITLGWVFCAADGASLQQAVQGGVVERQVLLGDAKVARRAAEGALEVAHTFRAELGAGGQDLSKKVTTLDNRRLAGCFFVSGRRVDCDDGRHCFKPLSEDCGRLRKFVNLYHG